MPDSTDNANSGIGQGIASLAAFAVPALVAGLFGGGGVASALGAGMAGEGNMAEMQMERQKQGNQMLNQIVQQRSLQDYRQSKIQNEQDRNAAYNRAVQSTGEYHEGMVSAANERNRLTGINDQSLGAVRSATINHEQALTASTNLHLGEYYKTLNSIPAQRQELVKAGVPGAATMSDANVQQVTQKRASDYLANQPDVTGANIKWATDAGLPKGTVDWLKGQSGKTQAKFIQDTLQNTTKSHDAAVNGVFQWASGMKRAKAAGGTPIDPKVDPEGAKFQAMLKGGSAAPVDYYEVGKHQIMAIDQMRAIDPTNDLKAYDTAMGMTGPSGTPTSDTGTAVAKPAAPTPTSAGGAKAAAPALDSPIGTAKLPDGTYHLANGKAVTVKAGKVYPAGG